MSQVIGTSPLTQLSTPTAGFSVLARGGRRANPVSSKLNLVSLMDIFTILVFFLMLNSGDVEILQPDEAIALPESTATLKPDDVPVIKVTPEAIVFRDQQLLSLAMLPAGDSIPELEAALNRYSEEHPRAVATAASDDAEVGSESRGVSIMSDANTSYALLKRVLSASAAAGYRDIGLATQLGASQASTASTVSVSQSG